MLNMWKVRELVDKATNVVMNYSEIESKVREATNDDPWGPSGQLMGEIAKSTFMYEQFPEVMNMLWTRMLKDNKKNWRRVYKALLLLAYLIRNGSERVVTSAREHIYDLRSLENYHFVAGERFDSETKSKWDEEWEKSKSGFPFSEKLGEISDKIGSTIDDTINKFRKKERDDSPDRISDNEEDRISQNGRPAKSEFKDEEETVTPKNVQVMQATETTATTGTTTRKRGGMPSKTVDLGAAAHYTGDKSSPDAGNTKTSGSQSSSGGLSDLLVVDSETHQLAPSGGSSDLIADFADFSSPAASASLPSAAESASTGNGEFGDWSAFSSNVSTASSAVQDLFTDAPPSTQPPSADLFDLMDPSQSSLNASQSMTFTMCPQSTGLSMSRSQTLGGPVHNLAGPLLPQQMGAQKPGGKTSMPPTWSDPSVNISLDFLSMGINPPKPSQPSLNTMMQQGVQPPVSLVTQNFAGMMLNTQPVPARPAMNPGMASGNMSMVMPPTMATGNMGIGSMVIGGMPANQGLMGMNMASAGLGLSGGLGMSSMSMGQGMNSAMLQTKSQAFPNFGNFGQ
ncbi:clathrin interactor 1 isoform X7 [Neoarius graeffei]|uniref:clathrin interactor 1 isoform X7 n=1 Tax=Neoarius graeffei TaxID=443677 RepID=UPI00298C1837|nr:clathrin interactor 1 isoform X7 [Neoarius graeffei]